MPLGSTGWVFGVSWVGFGWNVRLAGAVPGGTVLASNSGAKSAGLAFTPGLCCSVDVRDLSNESSLHTAFDLPRVWSVAHL